MTVGRACLVTALLVALATTAACTVEPSSSPPEGTEGIVGAAGHTGSLCVRADVHDTAGRGPAPDAVTTSTSAPWKLPRCGPAR